MDVLAFVWLRDILGPFSTFFQNGIKIAFWTFTAGLILAILWLKIRLDRIPARRKYQLITSLYGLTVSSIIPKLIFVIVISSLFFTNEALTEQESFLFVPLAGVFAGFLPFFIIVHGIFRTLYLFQVKHIKLEFKNLPKPFNGLKIIHISDLHLGSFNYKYRVLDRAIRLINQLEADYIFFTGDLVNNFAWELKGWESTLIRMEARKGKFAVLGNHDYGDYSTWDRPE
ncbi:MAG: metallophosphoesterase, partial [Bacteroidetes bacterium]